MAAVPGPSCEDPDADNLSDLELELLAKIASGQRIDESTQTDPVLKIDESHPFRTDEFQALIDIFSRCVTLADKVEERTGSWTSLQRAKHSVLNGIKNYTMGVDSREMLRVELLTSCTLLQEKLQSGKINELRSCAEANLFHLVGFANKQVKLPLIVRRNRMKSEAHRVSGKWRANSRGSRDRGH